jgi:hypothetical protein
MRFDIRISSDFPEELSRYCDELRAGMPEFDFRQEQEIPLFSIASGPALEPSQPPIQWVQDVLSLGVQRQKREADYYLDLVWMSRIIQTLCVFMTWCLIN